MAVLASIPLFFTFQIKHILLFRGMFFVVMYSAGLVSVLVVPLFFLLEAILAFVAAAKGWRDVRTWHVIGTAVTVLAEVVFLIARTL